jgi:hypothetical protein
VAQICNDWGKATIGRAKGGHGELPLFSENQTGRVEPKEMRNVIAGSWTGG